MICSMTGFGSAHIESELGIFEIEMRGINNRFLDCYFRLSGSLSLLEQDIRKMIGDVVKRGRIEVSVRWIMKGEGLPEIMINKSLFEKLYQDAVDLKQNLDIPGPISMGDLLSIPSLYIEIPSRVDEKKVWKELKKGIRKALNDLQRTRKHEGKRLSEDLLLHLQKFEELWHKVHETMDDILEKYRQRLMKKIEEFNKTASTPVDQQRLDAEVILYADRSDISEELARLSSHIAAFRECLESDTPEPKGKQMDFICQELHREVNTIGNKSHESTLSNIVLSMKNIVEKLREQVQNVE